MVTAKKPKRREFKVQVSLTEDEWNRLNAEARRREAPGKRVSLSEVVRGLALGALDKRR